MIFSKLARWLLQLFKYNHKAQPLPQNKEPRCPCGGIIYAETELWLFPICYRCYSKPMPMDMRGDPVFDSLLPQVPDSVIIQGGKIKETINAKPNQARRILDMHFVIKKTGQKSVKSFNYAKIYKRLLKEGKIQHG